MRHSFLLPWMVSVKLGSLFMMAASALSADSRALHLVGVLGALVTEHVANEEDQGAEDGEDDHGNDPWGTQDRGARG